MRGGSRPGAGRRPSAPKPESEEKRLPWRPSKYDPAFCDHVVDAMRQGFSLTGFAGQIGVSRATITNWMSEFPDFLAAVNVAKAARASCWEERANKVGERGGGPGTATIIVFALKNLAPEEYRDKFDHTLAGPDGGPIRTAASMIPADLSGLTDDELAKLYGEATCAAPGTRR